MSPGKILLVACGLFTVSAENFDYCNPMLCPSGGHVACGAKPKVYGKKCSIDAELLPMNDILKDVILTRFNELRNQLAGGGFAGFTPVERMATLLWDDELSYLAEINVLKCKLHHDICRNTNKFGHVGQTVSYRGYKKKIPELEDVVTTQINVWFREHELSSMEDIFNYNGPNHGKPKENFIQMVMENNHRVGCAVLQQTENGWLQTFLTCNYAKAPVVGKQVFESSVKGGSLCKTGNHPTYSHLCSDNENYDDEISTNGTTTETQESEGKTTINIENQSNGTTTPESPEETNSTTVEPIKSRGKPTETTSTPEETYSSPQTINYSSNVSTTSHIQEDIYGIPISFYWANHTDPQIALKKKMYAHFFGRFIDLIQRENAKWKNRQIVIMTNNHEVVDNSKHKKKRHSESRSPKRIIRRTRERMFQNKRRRYEERSDEKVNWIAI